MSKNTDSISEIISNIIEGRSKGNPATEAYAKAIGCSVDELANNFLNHPVGVIIDEKDEGSILVRSPQIIVGTKIKFCCNILENMEVSLLESKDIIKETQDAIANRLKHATGNVGLLVFDCIYRKIELESKDLASEYGKIFKDIPTVGFHSYGETFVGHLNQTARQC